MPFPLFTWLQRALNFILGRASNKDTRQTSASGSSNDYPLYDGIRNATRRLSLSRTSTKNTTRRLSLGQAYFAMNEHKKVLVYHHHADGKTVLPGGKALGVVTNGALEDILREHTTLKLTRKALPPGTTTIDIYQKDIASASPSTSQENLPNAEQNVATVSVPWKVQLANLLLEKYPELIILSWKVGGGST